ncbi:uncharacterized protein LOC125858374 [Solanum stenotomum]|uniref:uncharacterized protein LOC125858374 n=1 Tax=Solanum stenotomum TaxID=172797 RepID=UPI0020D0DBFC|nr:uncharacterized protein LOC125858374 [Solanum stenotomum]
MSHPSDGEAWKKFDQCHPNFASEPRNIRLGLAADGFSPYGNMAHPYSCWPVIITPYNLPPEMCMTSPYMFLSLLIPGPKSPGKNIDIYLEPFIDELKQLWVDGVETYDSHKKQNFQMRAALMWTTNDFPAYGMLSGWSTHGLLACPCCMGKSKAFYLKHGRKGSFFDCHRKFLPMGHPFRLDRKSFLRGRVENSTPPHRLSGEEVWNKVCTLPKVCDHHAFGKLLGFGDQHNWTKQSIFWELPYWSTNIIRHNLDVMHIEKNVFDNIFNTIMDVTDKTKDNLNARRDVQNCCNRPELELLEHEGKILKPKAAYSLTKEQRKLICEWLKSLRYPYGYASNLSRCVDMEDCKLSRMKSHDCHVFLERLLPIAFRDLLPEPIWNALTEISLFFKGLCANVLKVEDLQQLEESIKVTICKLEKIFPPGFFDPMEHLPIHLPYEAIAGGPVHFRWMYPFEREIHTLKKMVKNRIRVEGSICEAYIIKEISTFSSHYFQPNVQTRHNKVTRNDDGGEVDAPDGCLSIVLHPGCPSGEMNGRYLSDKEWDAARIYVLLNCEEIQQFIPIFEAELKRNSENISLEEIDKETNSRFANWFEAYVLNPTNNISDERLRDLASGPYKWVQTWPQYFTNGYRFHTLSHGSNKSTMNSGVCIKGTTWNDYESDYYGLLGEVIQLEYSNPTKKRTTLVLFKCDWFDPTMGRGCKVHNQYGLIDINHKKGSRAMLMNLLYWLNKRNKSILQNIPVKRTIVLTGGQCVK